MFNIFTEYTADGLAFGFFIPHLPCGTRLAGFFLGAGLLNQSGLCAAGWWHHGGGGGIMDTMCVGI